MLTKQQLRILEVFKGNIFEELTFKQIKEKTRQKSNNIVQLALKQFIKENLIAQEKISDIYTYKLNQNSNILFSYLNLINEEQIQIKNFPETFRKIQQRILKGTEFFILIVFGSHAKGTAKEKSDLDVAVITESEKTKKEIIPALETIWRRELPEIHYLVFPRAEFIEMLRVEEENVGKQIFRHGIILYGYIEYLNLIKNEGRIPFVLAKSRK